LNECRVLVTPRSFGQVDASIIQSLEASVSEIVYNPENRPLKASELAKLLSNVDGYIAGLDEIDETALEAADHLRVIARYGTGTSNVDIDAATARGIFVTNTPGANAASVAELTIGLILTLARSICNAAAATCRGEWPRADGWGLHGKTIGIVGLGAIGREVAFRLKAFGCDLLACDPAPPWAYVKRHGIKMVTLDAMLPQCSIVTLHTPLLPTTRRMVDRGFLTQLREDAILVNTARAELIDKEALIEALEEGRLGGVALDGCWEEPVDPMNPLLGRPDVIVTPHIGAHTDTAVNAMGGMAVEACLAALRGQIPPYAVNPEA
jgi:phosphoglycerate dehydrogenase-like enzyme